MPAPPTTPAPVPANATFRLCDGPTSAKPAVEVGAPCPGGAAGRAREGVTGPRPDRDDPGQRGDGDRALAAPTRAGVGARGRANAELAVYVQTPRLERAVRKERDALAV